MANEAERAWPHSQSVAKPGSPFTPTGDTFHSNDTEQLFPLRELSACSLDLTPAIPHPTLSQCLSHHPWVTNKDLSVLSLSSAQRHLPFPPPQHPDAWPP